MLTGNDIVICEIGGTVGDIESLPFLEATRQMRLALGAERTLFIHLTLVPYRRRLRRAQDQADPAQRQGAPGDRHPAGHPALPHRPRPLRRHQIQDRAVHERPGRRRRHGARRRIDLRDPAELRRPRPRRDDPQDAPPAAPEEEPGRVGGHGRPGQASQGHRRDRARRQVRRPPRFLHEPEPGPHPRRPGQPALRQDRLDRSGGAGEGRPGRDPGRRRTASSSPAGSASAASRARSGPSPSPARTRSRSSGSAWACSARRSSTPARSPG